MSAIGLFLGGVCAGMAINNAFDRQYRVAAYQIGAAIFGVVCFWSAS